MQKKLDLKDIVYKIILAIMIGLPSIKLLSYFLYFGGILDSSFHLNQVWLLWAGLPLLIITYIVGIKDKEYKINYIDYIIYGLIILAFISTFIAQKPIISIFGEFHRNEGLLSLLSYYFIFLNVKNLSKDDMKKLIKVFVILGVFQVIYAILQVYTPIPFIKRFNASYMGMGLCANPNFFGSYMVMLSLLASTLYLLENKNKYLLLAIIFFLGLCLANSTGPFLGFALAFIFLIIVFFKKIKNYIFLMLIFIFVFLLNDALIKVVYSNEKNTDLFRVYNIKYELIDTFGNYKEYMESDKENYQFKNTRLQIWERALPVAKEYFFFGAGLDNFKYVYPQKGPIQDKAHNVYLQMLITNGIFTLILYCSICLIIFLKGFKIKDKFTISLYIAFVGYSIQAFANISVIDVAPYFFIILAILNKETQTIKIK